MAVTVKTKIKRTGADARKAAASLDDANAPTRGRRPGVNVPDKSGANYVSRNALHVQDTGKKSSKVNYKPAPPLDSIESVAAPVGRSLNQVERARQDSNRTRDMRTNLGRGKAAVPEVE